MAEKKTPAKKKPTVKKPVSKRRVKAVEKDPDKAKRYGSNKTKKRDSGELKNTEKRLKSVNPKSLKQNTREIFEEFIGDVQVQDQIFPLWDKIKSPEMKLKMLIEMSKFVIPTLKSVEATVITENKSAIQEQIDKLADTEVKKED